MYKFITAAIIVAALWCDGVHAESAVEGIGDYMQIILPAYALGMTMTEQDWDGAREFAYSFASTQVAVQGLKLVVPEPRPNGGNKKSFPSGHAAAAFGGASFIHARYGINKAIVPYIMAAFTGYSRVHAKKHYLHDVLAGAAIGSMFTYLFVTKYDGLQVSAGLEHVKIGFRTRF